MRIKIIDNFRRNLKDKLSSKISERPRGRVQIFDKQKDGSKKLIDESNLIMYQGREWIAQRLFNQNRVIANEHLNYISWFGLGDGAASGGAPFTITDPVVTETELLNKVIINAGDALVANSGYQHPFDDITYLEDSSNNDEFLISQVTTTIGTNDANGPSGTTYYDLNEAGLYISDNNVVASVTISTIQLFAKVSFSTIRKNDTRELIFVWLIYL